MKFFRYLEYMFKMPLKIHKTYDEIREVKQTLNTLMSAQMVAHIDNPNVIFELQRNFHKAKSIHNVPNALKYLSLVNPVRSPSMELRRVGGTQDGGYAILCPPPIRYCL